MTDRDVRRGYETHAERYAAARSTDDRERAILDSFFGDCGGLECVLDAGCGGGSPVLRRLAADATAVGLDFARNLLDVAADAAPDARLVHGDVTALPLRDDAVDAVVAVDSVIHVPVPEHAATFAEFARVLRPGGRLLVSEAPAPFERSHDDWLGAGAEMAWHMAGTERTREHLRDAGFRVTEYWPAPDTGPDEPPRPPFFAARVD
ncbi:class I SAM-dependent methyltransferase [Halobacterium yunchengense]|uniref:class I SAM-dependent methyltransferase n=1 Tax=Halobacterium yunchengense TaxID=3108497 RepID=UPI003008AF00